MCARVADIASRIPGARVEATLSGEVLVVPPAEWRSACEHIALTGMELSDLTLIDRAETLDVVAHVFDSPAECLQLRTSLPPDTPRVASVTSVWPSADWLEREAAEMFGVTFLDHPDPRRLLLTDDFEGAPLRKAFLCEESSW